MSADLLMQKIYLAASILFAWLAWWFDNVPDPYTMAKWGAVLMSFAASVMVFINNYKQSKRTK